MAMNVSEALASGSYLQPYLAFAPASITAAAGNDGTLVAGVTIDRLSTVGFARSAKVVVPYKATLADTKTLTVGITVEGDDNDSFSSATTLATYADAVIATGATPTTNYQGVVELNVPLTSAERYVRAKVKIDLSNTSSDTCVYGAVWVFGGRVELP